MVADVLSLRHASRELVAELAYLHDVDLAPRSHVAALIEIGARASITESALGAFLRIDKSTTSRLVVKLATRGWIKARTSRVDGRLSLTVAGRARIAIIEGEAHVRLERALATLSDDERQVAVRGVELYGRALQRSRRQAAYAMRSICARDRAGVAKLIRTVMPEFGAKGPGFAIHDPEVDDMFVAYQAPRSAYFVVIRRDPRAGEVLVGGGGYAPLAFGDGKTCELRKMYFLPELRGLGFGQQVLATCLAEAKGAGFARMYLETLDAMRQARLLYERNGFRRLRRAMGNTGHFACNSFYVRDLRK